MEEEEDKHVRYLRVISGGLAFLTAFTLILTASSWIIERFVP